MIFETDKTGKEDIAGSRDGHDLGNLVEINLVSYSDRCYKAICANVVIILVWIGRLLGFRFR